MPESSGAELALLLLGGFRSMVDTVQRELAERGHGGVRPVHEFALRAIGAGADTASDLGRRLGVSKQAAAKTIAFLEAHDYVQREGDPDDARRKRLRITQRGDELLTVGQSLFDDVRAHWGQQIGTEELEMLEAQLAKLVNSGYPRLSVPGWLASELGESDS